MENLARAIADFVDWRSRWEQRIEAWNRWYSVSSSDSILADNEQNRKYFVRKIQKARDQFIIQNKDIILAELNAQIMDTIDLPSDC